MRKPPPDAYRPTAAPASVETKPPPDAYKNPRLAPHVHPFPQPIDVGRALARAVPPVSMRTPPCVYPGYTHTPFHPSRRSRTVGRDTSTAHARGKSASPPHHKKQKKKKEPPPPFTNAKTDTHGGGRRRIQPTRGSVRSPHPRARWMAVDATSAGRGVCVPSTRTGRLTKKHTPTTDRAYARHRHRHRRSHSFARLRASSVRDGRVRSIRSTPRTRSTNPSHLDPRRLRASA